MIELRKYHTPEGKTPFDEWLAKLKDSRAKTRIMTRLNRLKQGNEGDWRSVGEDVRELRIPEGKGYRVYYAWDGDSIVLLLCGGDKSTQVHDIMIAKNYWRNYNEQ